MRYYLVCKTCYDESLKKPFARSKGMDMCRKCYGEWLKKKEKQKSK